MADNVNIELVIKAGQSAQTLGEIKQSIKDVTQALKDTKVGTEEFNKLKEVFQQNRANVKAMRQEFADLKQVETVGKTLTASFALASGAIGAFTGNSEKAEKAVRQLEGAFVMMESVQKLARAFREAAIANETFNKSLLTNPYVMVATAIAGIALAIYAFANSSDDAAEATKKLNESSLKNLQDSLKDLNDEQEESNKDLQHNIDLLKEKKATEGEIYAATKKQLAEQKDGVKEQLSSFNEFQNAQIEDYQKSLDRQKELLDGIKEQGAIYKQNNDAKEKGYQFDKDALEQSERFIKQDQEELDKEQKKVEEGKKLFEQKQLLLNKLKEIQRVEESADTSHVEIGIEERRKEILDGIIERIKAEKKAEDDYQSSLEHGLEMLKAMGGSEKEQFDFKLAMLGEELSSESKLEEKQKQRFDKAASELKKYGDKTSEQYKAAKAIYDAEKEAYDEIAKKEQDLINKKQVEIEINKQLALHAKQDAALKSIEEMDRAYDRQVAALKNITDVMKAKGIDDDKINKQEISNNQTLISSLMQQEKAVQDSVATDEEKKKVTDEISKKIQELIDRINVLQATAKKIDLTSIFGKATKEVEKLTSEIGKIAQVVSKVESLATQIVAQNVQRRIALYEHQNQRYVKGLDNALQEGFLSQQQYNQKVAAAEAELKKKKREEEHKEFVAKKATGIINATIQTALAVMQALSSTPPPASYAMAAIAGVLGAVQIAEIAAQKEPASYATGGLIEGAGTGTSDSILAKVSNGESVVNAKSTKMFAPLISAINQVGGGVALRGQQPLSKSPTGVVPNSSSKDSSGGGHQKVYVSEHDISKTQRKVKVIQNRSTH